MQAPVRRPPVSVPPPWSGTQRLTLIAVVSIALLLGWLGRSHGMYTGEAGDEATYRLLASSLSHGEYRDSFLVGSPAHAQYPPGYPLMVLALQILAGQHREPLILANLAFLGVIAILIADACRRFLDPWLAVATAGVVVLNPTMLHWAGWPISETLFTLFVALALWRALRGGPHATSRDFLPALGYATLALFTRSVGIAAVAGVVGGAAVQRRWRQVAAAATIIGALAVAWFAYTSHASAATIGGSYAQDFAKSGPLSGIRDILSHFVDKLKIYGIYGPPVLLGTPDIPGRIAENLAIGLLIAILGLIGLAELFRRWPSAATYLVATGIVLAIFPYSVHRLVSPILPWLIVSLVLGAGRLGQRFRSRAPDRPAVALLVALAGCAAHSDLTAAVERTHCRGTQVEDTAACSNEANVAFRDGTSWVRDHLGKNAVVATTQPSVVGASADVKTVPLSMLLRQAPAEVLAPTGPVTHVLLTGLLGNDEHVLVPNVLIPLCRRLGVAANPLPEVLILEVHPGDSADASACKALSAYHRDSVPD